MHQQRDLSTFRLQLSEDDVRGARLLPDGLKVALAARNPQHRGIADDADAIGTEPGQAMDNRVGDGVEAAIVPAVSSFVVEHRNRNNGARGTFASDEDEYRGKCEKRDGR